MNFKRRPVGRLFRLPKRDLVASTAVLTVATVAAAAVATCCTPALAAALPAKGVPGSAAEPLGENEAMRLAWRTRKSVEVVAERTESSETFATPNGTLRTRVYASPVWARQGTGWAAIDTTLEATGSVVTPKATTMDVSFSAGGDGPMVSVVRDGRSLSLSWPGELPKPTLVGDTATYAEVLPGVDLQLSAQVDSFSQVLVVKTPAAATNTELQRLTFGLDTEGVSVSSDSGGFLRAVTPEGEPVFVSDGARMWDKPQALPGVPAARARTAGAVSSLTVLPQDPEPRRIEDVPVHVDETSLTVVPSQAMLNDPATVYPVSIDPGFNGGKEIWTHVSRKSPSKSYWSDSSTRGDMRVGQLWGGSADDDWRTIVQFDTTPIKGATYIKRAALHVNVRHSADCNPSPIQLWRTNWVDKSKAVTWDSTKDKWWQALGTVNATANKNACPKGNDEVKFAQTAVKDAFVDVATKSYGTLTLAFRAKSESDQYQWKKLVPDLAYLDIEYNHKPAAPTSLAFSPCFAACGNGTAVTSTKQPKLSMKASDFNGGTLRYEYEVYASDQKTQKAGSGTTVTGVSNNAARVWTVNTALADGQYYWRGRACDTYQCGSYSGWFGFKVDTANPKNPTVASTAYPPTGWNGGPGKSGVFTISPGSSSDGIKTYTYALNGGTETQVAAPANGVVNVTLTPPKDLVNTLRVKAIDTAGNLSGAVDYVFKVKPVGEAWYWSLDEARNGTGASAPENNRPVTASGSGLSWSATGKQGESAVTFTGSGQMATGSPVFNTLSPAGFTVAAWVRLPAPPPVEDDADPGTDPGDNPDEEQDTPDDEQPEPVDPLPAGNRIAVSQDGKNTSMFTLGYRTDVDVDGDAKKDQAWCLTVASTDTTNAATTNVCTTDYVVAGSWVHLVGVVNPITNKIRLYVNGIPLVDGTLVEKPGKATWEATSVFVLGRGWTGNLQQRWTGEIDEVHVTPRVWTDVEIQQKASVEDAAS